jgi:hypothetical protein
MVKERTKDPAQRSRNEILLTKLLMLMIIAYMVPSMPSGHNREAMTMMGIVATHPTTD